MYEIKQLKKNNKMEEANKIEQPPVKKSRSRYWEEKETKELLNIWSQENIQMRLKSCTRKKAIWQEIATHLNSCGYMDRDSESCKTRIHTLVTAYRNYKDVKRKSTGTAPARKPPCFDQLEIVLSEKPTTKPKYICSSSSGKFLTPNNNNFKSSTKLTELNFGKQQENNVPDAIPIMFENDGSIEHSNISNNTISVSDQDLELHILNETNLSTDDNDDDNEHVTLPSSKNNKTTKLIYNKTKKRKSNSEKILETLSFTMEQFMKAQSEFDMNFLKTLQEGNVNSKSSIADDDEVILKIKENTCDIFIEIDFQKSCLTYESFVHRIKEECNIQEEILLKKLPDVLLRNDKDIKRLKPGQEIEFTRIIVEHYSNNDELFFKWITDLNCLVLIFLNRFDLLKKSSFSLYL